MNQVKLTKDERDAIKELSQLSISQIGQRIKYHWKNIPYIAKPYVNAICKLTSKGDDYYRVFSKDLIFYFLYFARTWRGTVARAIKSELVKRYKS